MMVLWRNELGMMEWYLNDNIMSEWVRNDGMTSEWWVNVEMSCKWQNDGRMRKNSESKVLPYFKNIPHFTFIQSFQNHSGMMKLLGMKQKWMEWPLNDIPPLSFSFLGIQEWQGMTEWGGMMVFLEVNKKLNSEIPLILPSFCPNLT